MLTFKPHFSPHAVVLPLEIPIWPAKPQTRVNTPLDWADIPHSGCTSHHITHLRRPGARVQKPSQVAGQLRKRMLRCGATVAAIALSGPSGCQEAWGPFWAGGASQPRLCVEPASAALGTWRPSLWSGHSPRPIPPHHHGIPAMLDLLAQPWKSPSPSARSR